MTGDPGLTVGIPVIEDLVRLAALEVPGVARVGHGGPPWRGLVAGPPVRVAVRDGGITLRLTIVARPAQPLAPLVAAVRAGVAAAIHRLLALELASLTVVVDGVGA